MLGLTKAPARELAPRGITVNAVAPGLNDAPMLRLSLDPEDDARAAAAIPLNRIGQPEDVAGAVRFLASASAAYLTGVTIDVNGGYLDVRFPDLPWRAGRDALAAWHERFDARPSMVASRPG